MTPTNSFLPDVTAMHICELMVEIAEADCLVVHIHEREEEFGLNEIAQRMLFSGLLALAKELGFYEDVTLFFAPAESEENQ